MEESLQIELKLHVVVFCKMVGVDKHRVGWLVGCVQGSGIGDWGERRDGREEGRKKHPSGQDVSVQGYSFMSSLYIRIGHGCSRQWGERGE
jgi:hypothetical protein